MNRTQQLIETMKKSQQKNNSVMKIKSFTCTRINEENLKAFDNEINKFTTTHCIVDIKVSTLTNNFGGVIVYTVIYEEDNDV